MARRTLRGPGRRSGTHGCVALLVTLLLCTLPNASATKNLPQPQELLQGAIKAHSIPLLERAVQAGADLDAPDQQRGAAPLLDAVAIEASPDFIKALVDAGASKKAVSRCGYTCLHYAARTGKMEIVRALTESIDSNLLASKTYERTGCPNKGMTAEQLATSKAAKAKTSEARQNFIEVATYLRDTYTVVRRAELDAAAAAAQAEALRATEEALQRTAEQAAARLDGQGEPLHPVPIDGEDATTAGQPASAATASSDGTGSAAPASPELAEIKETLTALADRLQKLDGTAASPPTPPTSHGVADTIVAVFEAIRNTCLAAVAWIAAWAQLAGAWAQSGVAATAEGASTAYSSARAGVETATPVVSSGFSSAVAAMHIAGEAALPVLVQGIKLGGEATLWALQALLALLTALVQAVRVTGTVLQQLRVAVSQMPPEEVLVIAVGLVVSVSVCVQGVVKCLGPTLRRRRKAAKAAKAAKRRSRRSQSRSSSDTSTSSSSSSDLSATASTTSAISSSSSSSSSSIASTDHATSASSPTSASSASHSDAEDSGGDAAAATGATGAIQSPTVPGSMAAHHQVHAVTCAFATPNVPDAGTPRRRYVRRTGSGTVNNGCRMFFAEPDDAADCSDGEGVSPSTTVRAHERTRPTCAACAACGSPVRNSRSGAAAAASVEALSA